jgi:hypothetical protein
LSRPVKSRFSTQSFLLPREPINDRRARDVLACTTAALVERFSKGFVLIAEVLLCADHEMP